MPSNAEVGKERIVFSGDERELKRLYAKALVYSLLSLGVYGFWAFEIGCRYLCRHTSFAGEAFAYHGKGGRLLLVALTPIVPVLALMLMIVAAVANRGGADPKIVLALMGLFPATAITYHALVASLAALSTRRDGLAWSPLPLSGRLPAALRSRRAGIDVQHAEDLRSRSVVAEIGSEIHRRGQVLSRDAF